MIQNEVDSQIVYYNRFNRFLGNSTKILHLYKYNVCKISSIKHVAHEVI